MPSTRYLAFLNALKGDLVDASDPLDVARARLEAMHGHPVRADTHVEWNADGTVRTAWVIADEAKSSSRVLLLCHGGAFIAAGGDGYLFYAEMLSKYCGARVLLVDYRLAPAHRFPAAVDDCVDACRALIAAGTAASRIAVIGDSCGGGIALATLLRLRDSHIPLPACAITLGGWFDLEAGGQAAGPSPARDPFAHPDFIRARGRDYLGPGGDPRHPLASPIHADPTGLPPLLLQVGQVDLTRDDAHRLARKAALAGVDVTLEIHPAMIHGFQGLASAGIPEGIDALRRVGDFIARWIPAVDA